MIDRLARMLGFEIWDPWKTIDLPPPNEVTTVETTEERGPIIRGDQITYAPPRDRLGGLDPATKRALMERRKRP